MSVATSQSRSDANLQDILERVDLPSMPQATLQILKLAGDPSASLGDMASVVATDPALTARVISLANSAYFGRGQAFADARRAVAHLGIAQIRSLALATHLFSFKPNSAGSAFDYGDFWRHCLACATTAKTLVRHLKSADPEEAFTAGLLQDLGALALSRAFPETYGRLWKEHEDGGKPLHELEVEELGHSHCDVGAALTASWGVSPQICTAIKCHTDPGDNHLARLCFLSDIVDAAIYKSNLVKKVDLIRVLRVYRCDENAVLMDIDSDLPLIAQACSCPSWNPRAEDHLRKRIRELLEEQ